MKQAGLILIFLISSFLMVAASCQTSVKEQIQYDGANQWLITKSIGSAKGTTTDNFWGSNPDFRSVWTKALKDRTSVGCPTAKAVVILGLDEGRYEMTFFDAEGNPFDSVVVHGGEQKTLEMDLPMGALELGEYRTSGSDAKGVQFEIRLIFPS
jgi:hypothetical protein